MIRKCSAFGQSGKQLIVVRVLAACRGFVSQKRWSMFKDTMNALFCQIEVPAPAGAIRVPLDCRLQPVFSARGWYLHPSLGNSGIRAQRDRDDAAIIDQIESAGHADHAAPGCDAADARGEYTVPPFAPRKDVLSRSERRQFREVTRVPIHCRQRVCKQARRSAPIGRARDARGREARPTLEHEGKRGPKGPQHEPATAYDPTDLTDPTDRSDHMRWPANPRALP